MYLPTFKLQVAKSGFKIRSLSVDEINNQIYLVSHDSSIQILNVTNLDSETKLHGHQEQVSMLLQIDNRRIASCSNGSMIIIWDIVTFEQIQILEHKMEEICVLLLLSPDLLLSGSCDCTMAIWKQNEHKIFEYYCSYVSSIEWGQCVPLKISTRHIAVSSESYINIYNLTELNPTVELRLASSLRGHSKNVNDFKLIGRQPQCLLSCAMDGSCKLWNLQRATLLKTFSGPLPGVLHIAVLDSNMFIGGYATHLTVWRLFSGIKSTTELQQSGVVSHLEKLRSNQIAVGITWEHVLILSYE
jgi:WD40 repeat protein